MGKEEHTDVEGPQRAELGWGQREQFRFDVRKDFLLFGLPSGVWAPVRGPAIREREEETLVLTTVNAVAFGVGTFQL